MRAGRLRHRLTIQQPVESRDDYGSVTTVWQTVASRWGSVEPQRGREALMSGQNTSEVFTEIRLRHLDGLTAKMRILHGSDTYQIRVVMNISERDAEHVCACTRIEA